MKLVDDENSGSISVLDILSDEDDDPIVDIIDFQDEDVSIRLEDEPVEPVDDLRQTIYESLEKTKVKWVSGKFFPSAPPEEVQFIPHCEPKQPIECFEIFLLRK